MTIYFFYVFQKINRYIPERRLNTQSFYLGQNSLFLTFRSQIFARQMRPSPTHCRKVMSFAASAQLGEMASLKFLAQTSAGNMQPLHPSEEAMEGCFAQNSNGNWLPKSIEDFKEMTLKRKDNPLCIFFVSYLNFKKKGQQRLHLLL